MPNSFQLSYPSDEFDLRLCVSSGQVFRWEELSPGEWLGVDGPYWYRVSVSDESGAKRPSRSGRVGEERTGEGATERAPSDITATPQHPNTVYSVTSNATEADFVRLFRFDWSTAEIERQILEKGPELAPYMEGLRGLRVLRCTDAYEVLFTFLCTPNNNLRRITSMVRRLAEYGQPMAEIDGQTIHRFPRPEIIAAIPEAELREKGFGYRARTIPRVAQQLLMKPPHWLESLKDADYHASRAELCTLDGVGAKLADCIALFGLHHMEAAPVDTHLWQAACRLYFPDWKGKALTDMKYRQLGDFLRERFGDLTGWAHQYLFYENLLNWRTRK